jgi:voltage-gated potassium channel
VPVFVLRLSRLVRSRLVGWRLPLAIAVFVLLTSWGAMWLVEPAESDLTAPANYWWFFVVTAATVGYGDFFPTTPGGRVVGAYVIGGGIVTLTTLFTQLADHLQSIRGKRMRGIVPLDLADHVVLLGYTPGRTERIISELTAEGRLRVALCAWDDQVAENPVPGEPDVEFVRGDLTRAAVMQRSGLARARTAVIDGRDDNETLAIAVAVDHVRPDIHMVAALRDLGRREHLRYVNPRVQAVQWHMPSMLTEEAVDPGITEIYRNLMTPGGDGNTYSLTVPAGFRHDTFGRAQTYFGQAHRATLLAVRDGESLAVSPSWDSPLRKGATLYYVAAQRVDPSAI